MGHARSRTCTHVQVYQSQTYTGLGYNPAWALEESSLELSTVWLDAATRKAVEPPPACREFEPATQLLRIGEHNSFKLTRSRYDVRDEDPLDEPDLSMADSRQLLYGDVSDEEEFMNERMEDRDLRCGGAQLLCALILVWLVSLIIEVHVRKPRGRWRAPMVLPRSMSSCFQQLAS